MSLTAIQASLGTDFIDAVHFAPWYRNQMRLELGDGIRSWAENLEDLDVRADFVSEKQLASKYLHRGFGNSYDFNQTP